MQSILFTMIRKITATLEMVSPRLALWWVSRLFFSPRSSRRELPDIPDLQQRWLSFEKTDGTQGECKVYSAGSGPVVLLIHGWEGSAYSFSVIARQLLGKGLRVVLFDLPAHGFSPGRKTNLVEISRIIEKLAAEEEHLQALVGHSFGAVCAGFAIKSGVSTDCFISISAPATMDFMINRFCLYVGASEKTKSGLIDRIETILKGSYEQGSLTSMADEFNQSGLIIHDRKDRMIPYKLAEEFAAAWPTASLLSTNALGHNRILQDDEVSQAVTLRVLSSSEGVTVNNNVAVN